MSMKTLHLLHPSYVYPKIQLNTSLSCFVRLVESKWECHLLEEVWGIPVGLCMYYGTVVHYPLAIKWRSSQGMVSELWLSIGSVTSC